jgi:hypothetical protein
MKFATTFFAATAMLAAPAAIFAKPAAPQSAPTTTSSPFGHTGQPSQSCEDDPFTPGNSVNAPGSAFNPDGNAGTHYAGEQPGINDKNPNSVSQYDTACARNQSTPNG